MSGLTPEQQDVVDSPMVLYEIFGHRDIEMTLHYILANKDLKQEVEAIAREIVAGAEKTVPSKTRKVKESEPTNPELAR